LADRGGQTDFNPRHRILGAVILVTLAVILLPMILREQPPPKEKPAAREIALPLPGSEAVPESATPGVAPPSAVVPPPPEPDPSFAAKTEPSPPIAAPPAPAAAPKPAEKPTEKPAAKPVEKKATTPAKAPATIQKGWVIQVGAFSHAANAQQLRDRLRKQGYKAEAETITVDKGTLVRVVVGPYGEKAEAKRARDRLSREQNLKGVLIAWPTRG
jgi:DedD protein